LGGSVFEGRFGRPDLSKLLSVTWDGSGPIVARGGLFCGMKRTWLSIVCDVLAAGRNGDPPWRTFGGPKVLMRSAGCGAPLIRPCAQRPFAASAGATAVLWLWARGTPVGSRGQAVQQKKLMPGAENLVQQPPGAGRGNAGVRAAKAGDLLGARSSMDVVVAVCKTRHEYAGRNPRDVFARPAAGRGRRGWYLCSACGTHWLREG